MKRIDVHAHLLAPDYLDLIERLGGIEQVTRTGRSMGWSDLGADLDARRAAMERAAVDVQILSISANAPYFRDPEKAIAGARFANDLYAAVVREGAGRFAAFATLPLPHVDAAIAEATRALDELGMLGITLNTSVFGVPLADPSFEGLFAALDRRGAAVFIHPAGLGCGAEPIRNARLTFPFGAPVEDTVCALQLIQADFPTRFPHLRIICSHLGGTLPFLMERLTRMSGMFLADGTTLRERVRHFWYDTVNGSPGALQLAHHEFGADRLLLGTDYPFWRGDAHQHAVDYVAQSGLPPDDLAAIFAGNAQALFGERAAWRIST